MKKVKVLVVGLGNMGLSHARAYKSNKGSSTAACIMWISCAR